MKRSEFITQTITALVIISAVGVLPKCESSVVEDEKDGEVVAEKADIVVKNGHSIQNAIDTAKPGDTILVAAGNYNEKLELTKDNVKVVCAQAGQCKITVTSAGMEGIVKIDAAISTFSGFEIDGGGTSLCGADVKGEKNTFSNNIVHNINKRSGTGSAIGTEGGNNLIKNNLVYDTGHSELDHGIYLYNGSATIEGNTIHDVSGFGIHLWHTPHDAQILNNTAYNNGTGGITVGAGEHDGANARNILVEGNTTYGNKGVGGIQEAGTVSDNVYRNNDVEDGMHLKSGRIEN